MVGSDFSSLQSAVLTDAAQRHQALQQSIDRLLSTAGQLRQQQNVNAQMAQQKVAFAAQQRQLAMENAFRQQQADIASRKVDVQNQIGQGYLQLGRDQLDLQKQAGTPAQNAQKEREYQHGAISAGMGIFDPTNYKNLDPGQLSELSAANKATQTQKDAEYEYANNAAGVLNRSQVVDAAINRFSAAPLSTNDQATFSRLFSAVGLNKLIPLTGDQQNALAALNREKTQLDPVASRYRNNPNLNKVVTLDSSTGQYTPSMSPGPWRSAAGAQPVQAGQSDAAMETINSGPAGNEPANASGTDEDEDEDEDNPLATAAAPAAAQTDASNTATNAPDRSLAGAMPAASAADPLVQVRSPIGVVGTVPRSRVQDALKGGFSVIQPTPFSNPVSASTSMGFYMP